MVVYFSGTGNSRYCAAMFADRLGDALLDSAGYIRHGIAADLVSGKPWVFVAPTYAWRIPRAFEAFIRTGCFHGAGEAYFVMTCGSEIGDPGPRLKALCKAAGLAYRGVLQVVMPENYIAMFDVPDVDAARRITAAARPSLEAGITAVREGVPFPAPARTFLDRVKTGPVNPLFYIFCVKTKPFYAKDACTGCGACEELCPLGNITLAAGKPRWGNACTHCMRCICGCPEAAVEYGKKSLGKPRYRCEPYHP